MQYKRRKAHRKVIHLNKAVDVIYSKMMYYTNKAEITILQIAQIIKDSGQGRGDLLAALHKDLMRCNDIAIDCAKALAPFQSAKLQSVEVKKTVEHKFVVRAPAVIPSNGGSVTDNWLNQVTHEQKLLPQPEIFKKSSEDINTAIEDIEELSYEEDYFNKRQQA